jgi:hypothetical protein
MKYELEGFYMLNGNRGIQRGEITQHLDGKLVGIVRDYNAGGEGTKKIILGQSRDTLRLLKVAPLDFCMYPVLWQLSKKSSSEKDLSGIYIGEYIFMGGFNPDVTGLEMAQMGGGALEIEDLVKEFGKISSEELDRRFFEQLENQEVLEHFKQARLAHQTGEITFKKI